MSTAPVTFWLTCFDTLCWVICFWWMHRISTRQDAVLAELREQARRIERLSKSEHDMIKEVHPAVSEIKEGVNEVVAETRRAKND
jgi:hypothetical protein